MIEVTVQVSKEAVANLLSSGFEGHMTKHWCRIMCTDPNHLKMPIYDYPLHGGSVTCRLDDGETKETDRVYTPLVLNWRSILSGLRVMADRYPRSFAELRDGSGDAVTGDVFIQCCLLGEVRYG